MRSLFSCDDETREKKITFGNLKKRQDFVIEIENNYKNKYKKKIGIKKINNFDDKSSDKINKLDSLMFKNNKNDEINKMGPKTLKKRESKIILDLIQGDKSPVSNHFSSRFDAIASDDEASVYEKSSNKVGLNFVLRRFNFDSDLMMFKIGRYFKDISDKIILHAELDRIMAVESQNGNNSNTKKLLLAVVIQGLTLGGYIIYHFSSVKN
jgi:hypothetical protein